MYSTARTMLALVKKDVLETLTKKGVDPKIIDSVAGIPVKGWTQVTILDGLAAIEQARLTTTPEFSHSLDEVAAGIPNLGKGDTTKLLTGRYDDARKHLGDFEQKGSQLSNVTTKFVKDDLRESIPNQMVMQSKSGSQQTIQNEQQKLLKRILEFRTSNDNWKREEVELSTKIQGVFDTFCKSSGQPSRRIAQRGDITSTPAFKG
jgi:hypothetical protein